MSKHDPKVRLSHMRDFAQKAVQLTRGKTRADVEHDEVLRLAVSRLLELIGEAATHVPADVRDRHPEIPWPKIVSMRNRLIHGYDDVDYKRRGQSTKGTARNGRGGTGPLFPSTVPLRLAQGRRIGL